MKKILLAAILLLCSSISLFAEDEYVFTEPQLRSYVREQVTVAVDEVTVLLAKQHAIEVLRINSAHAVEIAQMTGEYKAEVLIKDAIVEDQTITIRKLKKENFWGQVKSGGAGLLTGFAIGFVMSSVL